MSTRGFQAIENDFRRRAIVFLPASLEEKIEVQHARSLGRDSLGIATSLRSQKAIGSLAPRLM